MSIRENYLEICQSIADAAKQAGRSAEDITLVAVSKFVDEERIRLAHEAGANVFGESRAQELGEKMPMFEEFGADVHFIGQLQTNKVKYIIGRVKTIQSVDRIELANEISRLAQKKNIVQDMLIEVNIGSEPQKGGAEPDKLNEFLSSISRLPGIRVDGLMCIPPAVDRENVRRYFAMMRELFEKAKGYDMPNVFMNTLSMGMSGDYRAAVAEGATMVRVGRALFGERMRPGPKA